MRFAHLTGRERPLAVVEGDLVAPLEKGLDGIATVDQLIASGPEAWDAAREAAPAALNSGELLAPGMLDAPLREPSKIACVGLNYHDHCRETGMAPPERPLIFAKFPSSLVGSDAAIEWPDGLTDRSTGRSSWPSSSDGGYATPTPVRRSTPSSATPPRTT